MPEIPENISRQDLLRAIDVIRAEGVQPGAHSSTYDVVHEGERFPPKLVVSIANRFANGADLDRQTFRGGLNTEAFQLLAREGFEVERKAGAFESGFNELKRKFVAALPDFLGFQTDQRYLSAERRYKFELVTAFEKEVRPLADAGDWESFGEGIAGLFTRPLKANGGKPQNIVGWRYYDPIRKLAPDQSARLGKAVMALIDEEATLDARLRDFTERLREITGDAAFPSAAVSRSIIAFLMTIAHPKEHFFLKTTEILEVVQLFDPNFRWDGSGLKADELRHLNALAKQVFSRLSEEGWEPVDLIDVQGFFWIALKGGQTMASSRAEVVTHTGSAKAEQKMMHEPLNQILYGPPGTGKTYHTLNKALRILDPDFLVENSSDRKVLKQRFDELREAGRIGAVTFHQSFSYEDFVEGLRASSDDDGQIRYEVEPGIFKRLCDSARAKATVRTEKAVDPTGRRIWKMSLGNTQGADSYIYGDCLTNNEVLLGWGRGLDYSNASSRKEVENVHKDAGYSLPDVSYSVTATNLFVNQMKPGDLIVVSDGNHKFRAVAEVAGDYRFMKDRDIDEYKQARSVNWLRVYSPSLPREQLMHNAFSQMTLYELKPTAIDLKKLGGLLGGDDEGVPSAGSGGFQVGQVFGRDYTVRDVTSDVLRLTKPNGARLGFDMQMLNELADLVRSGTVTLEDIAEKKVFEKTDVNLEKYLVHGYNNILPPLIEHMVNPSSQGPARALKPRNAWVLIIDEINRGNIANIFGELITLIEPSKREGAPEATEVSLPYSKEPFSVPGNLYIVGTMNTADRSLVHMDTALRRRFTFEAMMPNTQVLADHGIEEVEGVNVVTMLEVMNQRMELLYDREHTLGHSFLLPLADDPTLDCLADIFDRQILPLLEEYFLEDWARIRQVLGDDQKTDPANCFVVPLHTESSIQALLVSDNPGELAGRAYERNDVALNSADAYRLIYERDEA